MVSQLTDASLDCEPFAVSPSARKVSRERKGGARAAEILDRTPPCKGGALPLASKPHCFRPYPPMVLLFPANICIRSKSLGQAQKRRLSQENHLDVGILTLQHISIYSFRKAHQVGQEMLG